MESQDFFPPQGIFFDASDFLLTIVENCGLIPRMGKRGRQDEAVPERLANLARRELWRLKGERGAIARLLRESPISLTPNRISELMTGRREITWYYFMRLVRGGFVEKEQLLQGRRLDDLPEEEQVILDQLEDSPRLRKLMREARRRGIDLEALLETAMGMKA